MRFLLLLLPNLYDFFTLLMIGYAFILKNNSQLQLPIITACLLIYATTRIGIIAGELINKIINPVQDNQEIEEPAEVVAKKMLMGVVPQCILIIICQVVFALFFLQNSPTINNTPNNTGNLQEQAQVQQQNSPDNNIASQEQATDTLNSTTAEDNKITNNTNTNDDEEIVQPVVAPKPTKKSVTYTKKKYVSTKTKSSNSTVNKVTEVPQNNVYYEIPSKTLRAAGISPESRQQSVQANNTQKSIVPVQNNSNSWTFSASKTVQVTKNASFENNKQVPASSLNPKRYPGDDNPLNANWGYYKHTETQTKPTSQKPIQQTNPVNNIPANTLRSIGY